MATNIPGSQLIANEIKRHSRGPVFTLSGGHIFPILDSLHKSKVKLIDVRHEQSATFAAEAISKLTRMPGVSLVTAGPGVTNSVSAITAAYKNNSPLVVLAGRAPQGRWGQGSLQELDHLPILGSITNFSGTAFSPDTIRQLTCQGFQRATTIPRGPCFVDYPLDVFYKSSEEEDNCNPTEHKEAIHEHGTYNAEALLSKILAQRPVIIAGSSLWQSGAEILFKEFVEKYSIPTFLTGSARGILEPSSELAFSRCRSFALKNADTVIVAGTLLDFRLNFGRFSESQVLIHIVEDESMLNPYASASEKVIANLSVLFSELCQVDLRDNNFEDRKNWVSLLNENENTLINYEDAYLKKDKISSKFIYNTANEHSPKDSIIVVDGGDFVSWAGKLIEVKQPGSWVDSGPFGCLGSGLGYAMGAKAVFEDRPVICFMGDGAFGFSAIEVDTMARHGLGALIVIGNNGMWGLEKHPMDMLYGYDVAAELSQDTKYDLLAKALGGDGETVSQKFEFVEAFQRGLKKSLEGIPYVLNVHLDRDEIYPRSSNLA